MTDFEVQGHILGLFIYYYSIYSCLEFAFIFMFIFNFCNFKGDFLIILIFLLPQIPDFQIVASQPNIVLS